MDLDHIVIKMSKIIDSIEEQIQFDIDNKQEYRVTGSQLNGLDEIYMDLIKIRKEQNVT